MPPTVGRLSPRATLAEARKGSKLPPLSDLSLATKQSTAVTFHDGNKYPPWVLRWVYGVNHGHLLHPNACRWFIWWRFDQVPKSEPPALEGREEITVVDGTTMRPQFVTCAINNLLTRKTIWRLRQRYEFSKYSNDMNLRNLPRKCPHTGQCLGYDYELQFQCKITVKSRAAEIFVDAGLTTVSLLVRSARVGKILILFYGPPFPSNDANR